jgi:hypothetical protein
MVEFHATYELGLGAFSVFNPPFYGTISALLDGGDVSEISQLVEYLLFATNRFNVKFTGEEGKDFDIKELENQECNPEAEKWMSLTMGTLEEGKSVEELCKKLEELALTDVDKAEKLSNLVALLREGSYESVFVKQHLLTVKTSAGIMAEQIDFSVWRRAAKQGKRLCLRSVSLEGSVPEEVVEKLSAQLKAQYGSRLLRGGFATTISAALKLDPPEATQLRFFELEEAPTVSSFFERSLTCVDCSSSFPFTAEQQLYHATKGWVNEPLRCGPCQQTKKDKAQFYNGGGGRSYGGGRGGFKKKSGGEGKSKGV